jgi:hypothetical protein
MIELGARCLLYMLCFVLDQRVRVSEPVLTEGDKRPSEGRAPSWYPPPADGHAHIALLGSRRVVGLGHCLPGNCFWAPTGS